MSNGFDHPTGGPRDAGVTPPNVWRPAAPQLPAFGVQQWRSPAPAAIRTGDRPAPRIVPPPAPSQSGGRRVVDRPAFWYALMLVALGVLLLSFWLWNQSTGTQLGMSVPTMPRSLK